MATVSATSGGQIRPGDTSQYIFAGEYSNGARANSADAFLSNAFLMRPSEQGGTTGSVGEGSAPAVGGIPQNQAGFQYWLQSPEGQAAVGQANQQFGPSQQRIDMSADGTGPAGGFARDLVSGVGDIAKAFAVPAAAAAGANFLGPMLMGADLAGGAAGAGGAGWTSGFDLAGGGAINAGASSGGFAGASGIGAGAAGAGAAGAGGAGSAAAGAAGAAAGAPSWLNAVGPLAGIAAGANTLLNTPSGNGTGTGGIPSVGQSSATVAPGNLAAYQKLLGIDPSGYIAAGNQAGVQYADLAKQMQQYQAMMEAQAGNAAGAQTTLQGQGNQEFSAGNAMQTTGMGIMGNAQPLINAGNAIWNTAQDPQQALYQRTLQQIQDQSRSSTSARGIGMSGESAGIENLATGNFNIDWQNQQLARMLQGATGMATDYNAAATQYGAGTSAFSAGTGAVNAGTGAYNAAGDYGKLFGADTAAAAGFGAQVPGFTLASGSVPFQTQQTAYGAPLQAGQDYASATNTAFNPNLANYSNTQQQFGANQSAAGMNALMTGLYGYNPNSPYAAMGAGGNTPGSWLTTAFGGGNSGGNTGSTGYDPNSYMTYLNQQG